MSWPWTGAFAAQLLPRLGEDLRGPCRRRSWTRPRSRRCLEGEGEMTGGEAPVVRAHGSGAVFGDGQVAVVAAGEAGDAGFVPDGGLSAGGVDGDNDAGEVQAAELDGGDAVVVDQACAARRRPRAGAAVRSSRTSGSRTCTVENCSSRPESTMRSRPARATPAHRDAVTDLAAQDVDERLEVLLGPVAAGRARRHIGAHPACRGQQHLGGRVGDLGPGGEQACAQSRTAAPAAGPTSRTSGSMPRSMRQGRPGRGGWLR